MPCFFSEEPKVNCLQLYLLHRYIGQNVKVVLSGLGGDELFGGYDIYHYLLMSEKIRKIFARGFYQATLGPLMNCFGRGVGRLSSPRLDLLGRQLSWLGALHDGPRHYLLLRNAWDFNQEMIKRVYHPEYVAYIRSRVEDEFRGYFNEYDHPTAVMRTEFSTKLVNDLLHNEDTMSMAHSVESRVPWLDLEFVRFAARMPADIRFWGWHERNT